MLWNSILILLGLVAIIAGAEGLVRGSASLAKKWGIAPLVIGLTVVAFGTSAPELTVNIYSGFKGSADIAVGNVIGSNIANILLILGVSASIRTLVVQRSTVLKEIPFALLAGVLVIVFANDAFFDDTSFNAITRTDGLALIAMFCIFLFYTFSIAKNSRADDDNDIKEYSSWLSWGLVAIGLVGLVGGGKIMVDGAVAVASLAGISEKLIGLTIIAIGTSLPELATSVVAVMRKQVDIAIGNVIGSNIFNVFWILGLTSTIIPLPFNPVATVDAIIAAGAVLLLFAMMFIGKRHELERWQGILFLVIYSGYISFLITQG